MVQIETTNALQLNDLSDQLRHSLNEVLWIIEKNRFEELYVEKDGDHIKAIALSWRNSFHPYAKYVHFTEHASEQLISKVVPDYSIEKRVVFNCYENEKVKIETIKNLNFQLFRKTYMETYVLQELIVALKNVQVPSTLNIITFSEVLSNTNLSQQLFKLVEANYIDTHLDNPAKNTTWQEWGDLLQEDEAHIHNSYISIVNDQVDAYIFVHKISDVHYEIGLMGYIKNDDLFPLLKAVLENLYNEGVKTVEFEIDTTNYMTWQLADLLNFDKKLSFNAYMRL